MNIVCKACGHIVRDDAPCVWCWGHAADMREGCEPEPADDDEAEA